MNRILSSLAIAASAVVSLAAPAANATVFIGLQQDAGPIVTVQSNPGFAFSFGSFGEFEGVAVAAFGQPSTVLPLLLQGGAVVTNSAGNANAGTLKIYMTSTGNTAPLGTAEFTSGFATVDLSSGWTQTFQTYVDPGNGQYALTTLLGSATFSTVDSDVDHKIADAGAGPYSVTAVITIVAPNLGGASKSVGISATTAAIPEPASLALVGTALVGFGVAIRRQRKA